MNGDAYSRTGSHRMKTLNVGPHVNPNWLSVSTGNIYRIVEVIDDEHIRVNRLNASQQPDSYVSTLPFLTCRLIVIRNAPLFH